ncbi:MAG: hypothetical protein ACR2PK_16375 [Acidimicrobiales bacterium]
MKSDAASLILRPGSPLMHAPSDVVVAETNDTGAGGGPQKEN